MQLKFQILIGSILTGIALFGSCKQRSEQVLSVNTGPSVIISDPFIKSVLSYRRLEDFLSHLAANSFKDHLLVYQSLSLQPASFQNPRVILPLGDQILAYANPEKNLPHTLEILAIGNDSLFRAFEITFDPAGKNVPELAEDPKCVDCPRYNIRPNFPRYFFWPGFSEEVGAIDCQTGEVYGFGQPGHAHLGLDTDSKACSRFFVKSQTPHTGRSSAPHQVV